MRACARNHLMIAAWSQPARPLRKSLLHQPGERRRPATRLEPGTWAPSPRSARPLLRAFGAWHRVRPRAVQHEERTNESVGGKRTTGGPSGWCTWATARCVYVQRPSRPSPTRRRCGAGRPAHVHAVCTLSARYLYAICEPIVATAVDSLIRLGVLAVPRPYESPGGGPDSRLARQKRGMVYTVSTDNTK